MFDFVVSVTIGTNLSNIEVMTSHQINVFNLKKPVYPNHSPRTSRPYIGIICYPFKKLLNGGLVPR
ncbi:MAG: hypothetical protein CM1200mP35_10560 [Chloroflexota bacterium]|nr:MAG: hypothetical protein CM1200mP35_10560 [Chloroflexota bacterium]